MQAKEEKYRLHKSQMSQSEAHVTKPNGGQKGDQLDNIKANIHGDFIGS